MVKKIIATETAAAPKAGRKSSAKAAPKASRKAAKPVLGVAAGLLDNQIAASVKDSAQQIWLAGMGAFKQAQEEGGKVFEALVKEGMTLQKKTQGIAEDKISEVTGKMTAMAGTVSAKAGQNWDKLEAIFEQRTAKAMNKLGVPTAKDVQALVKRVDELAAAVAKLSKTAPAKPAAKGEPVQAAKAAVRRVSKAAAAAAAEVAEAAAEAAAAPKKAPAKRARKTTPTAAAAAEAA